jgi:uncharacterized protein
MRIFRLADLTPTPWKNGGGMTREIAVLRQGPSLVWRLSMADVDSDGPFSNFTGLTRVLTVTQGGGMMLVSPAGSLHARLAQPIRFDGGLPIEAKLIDGPLKDFNLIFDPLLCGGQVVSIAGPHSNDLQTDPQQTLAVHAVTGSCEIDQHHHLQPGDTALMETGAVHLEMPQDASALLVRLTLLAPV